MSALQDKYPASDSRRRFVKGVVGSAGLAGLGTASAGIVDATTQTTGRGGGKTSYYGVENIAGPAPRAMPQIPVEIDADGYLKGVWPEVTEVERDGRTVVVAETEDFEGTGVTYSNRWFQYCGVQTYAGLAPEADQDNYFRFAPAGPNLPYGWQEDKAGEKVHVDAFADYETWTNEHGTAGTGKPAAVTWRSQGVSEQETIPVELIRSPVVERRAGRDDWLGATTTRGFLAHLNKCTHFCCVPGFKTSDYETGRTAATDKVYCGCHQSIYDPFAVVERTFVALPRPE